MNIDLVVGARGVRDIEAALFVEISDNGPINQRRPGDQLNLEAHRQREDVAVQLHFVRPGSFLPGRWPRSEDDDGRQDTPQGQAFHEGISEGVS